MASNSSIFIPVRSSSLRVTGFGADRTSTGSSAATAKCTNRARIGRPESLGRRPVGDEHRGGTVAHLRRVARGDVGRGLVVGLPRRRQRAERLHRAAAPDAFVGLEHLAGELARLAVLDRDRHDLAGEEAGVGALRGAPVALERERVHLVTGDAEPVGEHLRDPELDPERVVVWRRKSALNGPVPPRAFVDIGARVIDSTPHAIARSYAPAITPWATKCMACCDEPHCRSTLVAGTCQGSPAATHALRVTLQPCSPDCVTQPPTTSSIRPGSTSDAARRDPRSVNPRRSVGCHPDRAPFRFPIGVRTVSTMTASRASIRALQAVAAT